MEPKSADTWSDLQAFKRRQTHLREKMQRRKREREDILTGSVSVTTSRDQTQSQLNQQMDSISSIDTTNVEQIERILLQYLCDSALKLPIDSNVLTCYVSKNCNIDNCHELVKNLLQKFALQELISLNESLNAESEMYLIITSVDHSKLISFGHEVSAKIVDSFQTKGIKRSLNDCEKTDTKSTKSEAKTDNCDDLLESLLSSSTIREKENKKMGEEILALLSKPTAKERSLVEQFQSVGGAQVQEFCQHGTKEECIKVNNSSRACPRLHFKKIIEKHTDESLGDCSFLNTCFHMDTCKYVHYKVDYSNLKSNHSAMSEQSNLSKVDLRFKSILYPAQWIRADLRFFDMSILGKFSVVMADPPWDIHMELPYGTMSDDEMRGLDIPSLQEEGIIFLWVTGRAMELGRECLRLWGYERCDEIIWVKTNQLQRIIRTGRTGHWINHGKEHCLVGAKGNPPEINRGLDCDVIVAEVRATSHKPDEIYGIIERLSPGTRKIELFGRQHNTQPNWVTLGNQLDGVRLIDPALANAYRKKYPEEAEQLIKESQEFVDKSKDI